VESSGIGLPRSGIAGVSPARKAGRGAGIAFASNAPRRIDMGWMQRWRDQGYENIYGTDLIRAWCTRYRPVHDGPIRILDVGCGWGRDLAAIRDSLGPARAVELYGVECTEDLSRRARDYGVSTVALDLETSSLPFPDGFFDIVTANQVLEHLKNWIWAFHQQVRVTRRAGLTLIGVPNIAALHNRVLVLLGRQPSSLKANGPHVRGFTLHELRRLAGQIPGLALEDVSGTYLYGLPPAMGRRLGQHLPGLSATVLLAFRKTAEHADVLSLLGDDALFETNYYVGERRLARA
jgi:SAM-dependent methyltransferase